MTISLPYLDGWLSNLKELSKKEFDANLKQYISQELDGVETVIASKEIEAEQLDEFEDDPKYDKAIAQLGAGFKAIRNDLQQFRKELDRASVKPGKEVGSIRTPGIRNAGNSCYMNSALQGLLGSSFIVDRIKAYNKNPVPQSERFMPALKKFVAAYEGYMRDPSSKASNLIGSCASELRAQLYYTRLKGLDVEELNAIAEADLIVMVLGETLNLEYKLVTHMTGNQGRTKEGAEVQEAVHSAVPTNQLLWPEIQTSGRAKETSLQEEFNKQCRHATHEDDAGWRTETKDGREITVDSVDKYYRIEGEPPPIIVFKVGKPAGQGRDAAVTLYQAGPRDEFLNLAAAMDPPHTGAVKYRLIGILENHGRVHWTAKSRREGGWLDCNDSSVTSLGDKVPTTDAAVMIYEHVP